MDLAVLANDGAVRPDENRRVEAARAACFLRKFRIAQIKADAELLRFVEQRLRFGGRNRGLVKLAVGLGLVFIPVAREKRRERELGKHDELRAHAVRVAQQFYEALGRGRPRVGQMERTQLGRGDFQFSHTQSLR